MSPFSKMRTVYYNCFGFWLAILEAELLEKVTLITEEKKGCNFVGHPCVFCLQRLANLGALFRYNFVAKTIMLHNKLRFQIAQDTWTTFSDYYSKKPLPSVTGAWVQHTPWCVFCPSGMYVIRMQSSLLLLFLLSPIIFHTLETELGHNRILL